ncbi:MAG TPA: SpvB/TcaC N-terminal domain-containing protein, partial [Anaerolineales bacterium]|nr:SpvB/TcaC N-terminal domain-containing protein [Anaerolineales bacterium]
MNTLATRVVHALVVASLLAGSAAPGAVLASRATVDGRPSTVNPPPSSVDRLLSVVRGLSSDVRSSRSVVRGPFFPVRHRPSAQTPTPPPNPPIPTGEAEVLLLDPVRGGSATAFEGDVRLSFPPRALRAGALGSLRRLRLSLRRVTGATLSGHAFEILAEAAGTGKAIERFDQPISITLRYEEASVRGDEHSLTIFYYDETLGTWRPLPTTVDTAANVLTARTEHLSTFDYNTQNWQAARTPSVAAFQVSTFTGAATYALPLALPPGPGGLQPSLSLSYNSQAVDAAGSRTQASWVGMGWSLETGSIQRDMHGTLDYEGDDTFTLNAGGVSSLLLHAADGTDSRGAYQEYRTAEESFWRVRRYPAVGRLGYASEDDVWIAWDKGGTQYRFDPGPYYPDYRNCGVEMLRRWQWPLAQVTDRFGQSIRYEYATETKVTKKCEGPLTQVDQSYHAVAVYPAVIRYPHNRYRAVFVRTARTDYDPAWLDQQSFTLYQRSLLSEVRVEQDADGDGTFEQLIRKVVLRYATDPSKMIFPNVVWPTGGRTPTLVEVQEYGLGGAAGLPPTRFVYGDPAKNGGANGGLHLTRAENGYGGVVEFGYDVWHGAESVDAGAKQVWSPPLRMWQTEVAANGLGRPLIYPGATYHFRARLDGLLGYSAQIKLDTGASGMLLSDPIALVSPSPSTWEWQWVEATFTLPAGATQALPRIYCSFCDVSSLEMKLLPTRYRAAEKRLTDEVTGQTASFRYAYEGAAMNDTAHSAGISTANPYATKYAEFRGHSQVIETGPEGTATTTRFYQDDVLKGRPSRVQVRAANGDLLTE